MKNFMKGTNGDVMDLEEKFQKWKKETGGVFPEREPYVFTNKEPAYSGNYHNPPIAQKLRDIIKKENERINHGL